MICAVRARYLVAMGVAPSLAASLTACPPAAVSPTPAHDSGSIVAMDAKPDTAVAQTPTDEPDLVRRDGGGGDWEVTLPPPKPKSDRPEPGNIHPLPSCPSGLFCKNAPGKVTSAAPAPFANCEASATPSATSAAGRMGSIAVVFSPDVTRRERAKIADACCYSWFQPCPGGRPLRDGDTAVLAPPTRRDDWMGASSFAYVAHLATDALNERVASHFLAEAAAEHASVASFSRFSLQLLALGARPELVKAAHEAALDEIRHAERCYALASRYSGQAFGPQGLDVPQGSISFDPAIVAMETLRDGCLGESLAARSVAMAASLAHDESTALTLREIADDEERHAELAWSTVAWLLDRNPEPVRRIIESFVSSLEGGLLQAPLATASDEPNLEAHGVLGRARQVAVQREAVREIVVPCLRALLADRRAEHEPARQRSSAMPA